MEKNLNVKSNESKYRDRVWMTSMLSSLWIFLSLNYILCDVLSNMEGSVIRELMAGQIAGVEVTQGFLLIVGISLEIPFLMVILSKILPDKSNKIVNIIAALVMIAYQLGSYTVGGETMLHYHFFSAIEVAGNLGVLILALKWSR